MSESIKVTIEKIVFWAFTLLVSLFVAVIGLNVNREYDRNDDQEKRIQLLERATVKIDYMAETLNKIENKVDKLSGGR